MTASSSTPVQALHDRPPRPIAAALFTIQTAVLQYVSIKYSEQMAEAGIEPSVESVGESYNNALAKTINGLCKAELRHRR
jgi:transposase InsO family protein